MATCHEDCHRVLSDLWCWLTVNPEVVAAASDSSTGELFRRFLTCTPTNGEDEVLFRSILSWFGNLTSRQLVAPDLTDYLLSIANSSLLPLLELSKPQPRGTVAIARPSTAFSCLVFLTMVEVSCKASHIEDWIHSGLLGHLERLISNARTMTSTFIDAPTSTDGALPDEVYLSCALASCQTDQSVHAVAAMRLLTSLLLKHQKTLENFPNEVCALLQTIAPICLQLAVQNPTLASGPRTPTTLQYIPRCPRASRPHVHR